MNAELQPLLDAASAACPVIVGHTEYHDFLLGDVAWAKLADFCQHGGWPDFQVSTVLADDEPRGKGCCLLHLLAHAARPRLEPRPEKVDKKGNLLPALPADSQLVHFMYKDFIREASAQASHIEGVFNLYNANGMCPQHVAAANGKLDVLKAFISPGGCGT